MRFANVVIDREPRMLCVLDQFARMFANVSKVTIERFALVHYHFGSLC